MQGDFASIWLNMGLMKLLLLAALAYWSLKFVTRVLLDLTFDFRSRKLIRTSRTVDDLLRMRSMHFEHLCRMLFESLGYNVTVTEATDDGGIDLIGSKDGKTVVAQCKRFSRKSIDEPAVEQLYGSATHEHADRTFILTTSRFTSPAREFAAGKPITLIDKRALVVWINRYAKGELIHSRANHCA
jgi:restriction system protein